jgi:hypothetical protein
MNTFKSLAFGAILSSLIATAAHAVPVVYFGENLNPASTVSGAPVTARNNFLSHVVGVDSEGFETKSGTAPLTLNFTGSSSPLTATLTGAGAVNTAPQTGSYNTTAGGSRYWQVSGAFTIDFGSASPISAFGFYGTDIGDIGGSLTIALLDTHGHTTNLTVANTVGGTNGSLLFWGFTDSVNEYTKITFGNTATGQDVFGFDDMVVGDLQQVTNATPEPTTLALIGLGLVFASGVSRRKARRSV